MLAASATAYAVVKYAGAAYLVWLGLRTLWESRRPHSAGEAVPQGPRGVRRPWRTGFSSNILNPKIAVFYTSLLPQLVPAGAPHTATLVGLVVVHAVLSLGWLTAYAAGLSRASGALRRPRVRRALDSLTGLVLVGFGVRVAASGRHG